MPPIERRIAQLGRVDVNSSFLRRIRLAAGRAIRRSFESLTGWTVYTINPRGARVYKDVREYLPELEIETVFDVGANVGQSAAHYLDVYPSSVVYSFEPIRATFEVLEKRCRMESRVRCFNVAFSDGPGTAQMALQGDPDQYRFIQHAEHPSENVPVEEVQVATLDDFCSEHGISPITLLKVDTEGHDLAVLKGAETLLADQRIDLVQSEVAMSPLNEIHVPFEDVKEYMESHSYYLFGLYEQRGEWPLGSPVLRRTDAVFVSSEIDRKIRSGAQPGSH